MRWMRQIEMDFLSQTESDQQAIGQSMEDLQLTDESSLRVLSVGSGDPIIFVPMITELNFLYAPQVEEFSIDHRVILYEPRLSRHSRVSIADRASEMVLLMESLGLESSHIVAWSDAGAAAYTFAKQWPQRCRSVVFLGLPDKYRLPPPVDHLMNIFNKLPIEGGIPSSMLAQLLGKFMQGPQVKYSWVVEFAQKIPQLPRLFKHSCLPNMIEHKPIANEVLAPSLVICGDSDPVVTYEQAQRMTHLLPNAKETVLIPNGEHCLAYVNADAVNSAIRFFYRSLAKLSADE